MRLLYSPASPYSVKVRLAAAHCDLALDVETVDTIEPSGSLLEANPLGKIPTLVLDDGSTLYDSRVICDYFDRISGNLLVPQGTAEWVRAKRLEALADGVVDAAILVVYEARFRPEEMRSAVWTDRQWSRAMRGLDALEQEVVDLPAAPSIGHFALAGLLSWLELRFAGRWEDSHPRLVAWSREFATAFPPFADIRSKA